MTKEVGQPNLVIPELIRNPPAFHPEEGGPASTFPFARRFGYSACAMERDPAIYIVASGFHGTIYIGVTSNLLQRVYQHRKGTLGGFTAEHGCKRLVWFEMHAAMEHAIVREKRIKNWRREWKVALIEESNPTWRDLAVELGFEPLIGRKVGPGSSPG